MKYLFFALSSIFFVKINAQCIVDAGNDLHMCLDQNGFDTLNASITNAIFPIVSSWNYSFQDTNFSISETASSLLDDTSKLNPYFIERPFLHKITMFISIIDSIGNTCEDSVQVSYSLFDFVPNNYLELQKGDSGLIYAIVSSNYPPYSYQWSPNNMIDDNTVQQPKIWPQNNSNYQALVTDSMNCEVLLPQWNIIITVTDITNLTKDKIAIFPNPTKEILNISFDTKIEDIIIRLSNSLGQIVLSQEIRDNQIDISHLAKGVYHFQVINKDKVISEGNIIKE